MPVIPERNKLRTLWKRACSSDLRLFRKSLLLITRSS